MSETANAENVPGSEQPDERSSFPLNDGAPPAGEGEVGPPGTPSPPAVQQEQEEDVRNPELKKLHDEAARYRTNAKNEKQRADDATEALRTARMEVAFLHAAIGNVNDTDAAWKLADKTGITIDNEGNVQGADAVVAKVVEQYPYLAPTVGEDDVYYGEPVPATQPSGRQTNGPRKGSDGSTRAVLEKKFPALRGRT